MKVYLLGYDLEDGGKSVCGIYSSREKAIEAFQFEYELLTPGDIVEMELDPSNEDREAYQEWWVENHLSDGSKLGRVERVLPSECAEPHIGGQNPFYVICYAPTKEEAEHKAEEAMKTIAPVWQVGRAYSERVPIQQQSLIEIHHPTRQHVHKWELIGGRDHAYAVHEDLNTARRILHEWEQSGKTQPGLITSIK